MANIRSLASSAFLYRKFCCLLVGRPPIPLNCPVRAGCALAKVSAFLKVLYSSKLQKYTSSGLQKISKTKKRTDKPSLSDQPARSIHLMEILTVPDYFAFVVSALSAAPPLRTDQGNGLCRTLPSGNPSFLSVPACSRRTLPSSRPESYQILHSYL